MSAEAIVDPSWKSISVRFHRRVQGVFYRHWTVEVAKQLGVSGWVRNNRDGTVEAVFSGRPSAVGSLVEACKIWRRSPKEDPEVEVIMKSSSTSGNSLEFFPVEHPLEPHDIDKPVRCPRPEPCIVHDGRIWKERARRRMDILSSGEGISARRRKALSSDFGHLSAPDSSLREYMD